MTSNEDMNISINKNDVGPDVKPTKGLKIWARLPAQSRAMILVIGSTVFLCAAIFGTWEFWEYQHLGPNAPEFLRISYILRGAMASMFLAAWSAFLVRKFTMDAQKDHAALEEAVARAERLSVLGSFTAEIAHEVGNPLSAISSLVQTLHEEEKDKSRLKLLETAQGQIDRLRKSVDRLKGSIKDKRIIELISVKATISETISLLRFDGKIASNVDLQVEAISPDLWIKADRWGVIQILTNIILNACEALGDQAGQIRISVGRVDSEVHIVIRDSGPGISKEMMNKLFEMLETSKPDGMGVGLFVSRRIAESLGGTLAASNVPQGGAEFVLSLQGMKGRI